MRANEILTEAASYKEIEFVCANPQFPDATDPKLQLKMYSWLKAIPGVIPLYQDQSDYSEGQASLTAIYKGSDTRRKILALAKRLGVQVDLEQPVSDDYVDRALRGEHEGQIIYEGETIKGLPTPLYHGGSQPVTKFKIPPYGVFFSPHVEWAENYGEVITAVKVYAAKVYVLDHNNEQDDEILEALFDRDYQTVARAVQLLQSRGYHAMQTQTDSEMVCVFPGTRIQVIEVLA